MNICNYKPIHWQPNIVPDVNSRFRFVYRSICHIQASTFEFLYGANDPLNDPGHTHAIYLNTTDGTIWDWNNVTQIWELIYTPTGGPGGTQDLQSVLDVGNMAIDQDISLVASNPEVTGFIAVGPTNEGIQMAVENGEPFLRMQTAELTSVNIRANLVNASNNDIELPANSGTLALLSDIPPATPTVISTKTTSYTLQLSDADFDTLFEMNAATDEDFIVDSAVAFPIGTSFIFARRASGEVNIIPAGATIILSANGATNLTYKDSGATLIKVSATEWYLFGDIGAPITAAPGGSDREIQFNDGGVAFGGATGFTYDPANTNGIVELISTDDTKSLMSIQGPATSTNIFEIANEANPGVGDYFRVGANIGYMSGVWTISNGGQLNIATSASGVSDMFKLTNSLGTKTHSLSYTDTGDFLIRDVTNNEVDAFIKAGDNIGFGRRAGNYSNVLGSANNSFGTNALYNILGGQENCAFGANTLPNLTTGQYNVGVGNGALNSAVTTSRNTAIGWAAMMEGTTANYGTLVGWYAGRKVQGNYFTGLGYQAFGASASPYTQSGQKNIAIGDNTSTTLRTGSFNTVIGSEADVASAATDYGIALGYQASAASNQLAISPNVTQIKATGLTTSADRVLTDVAGNGILTLEPKRPYQVLIGNLTQIGTSAPTLTIFQNTTGTTFTMGYNTPGIYSLTANSGTPFTSNKTQVIIGSNINAIGTEVYTMNTSINSTSVIDISSASVSIGFDNGILNNTPIEIRIYP